MYEVGSVGLDSELSCVGLLDEPVITYEFVISELPIDAGAPSYLTLLLGERDSILL